MSERLTEERLREIREALAEGAGLNPSKIGAAEIARELLAEVERLRGLEDRIRELERESDERRTWEREQRERGNL